MVDISRQVRVDDVHEPNGGARHPAMTGTFAVTLVSSVTVSMGLLFDVGWGGPLCIWLILGAALFMPRLWAAVIREGATPQAAVAVPPQRHPVEARGVRRHHRYVPVNKVTALYTQEGRRIAARIANISVAAVAVDAKLSDRDYMAVLRVGSREVGPIRRTPTGAVFGFNTLLDPQPFDESFVL